MRIDYFVNLATAQAEPAIAHAFGRERQRAPFDRLEWWRALAEECLIDDQPLLAVARSEAGMVALPLMRRAPGRQLRCLANWYSFWAGPAFAGEDGDALLAGLAQDLPRHASRVTLGPLPAERRERLARAFASRGWRVLESGDDPNHRLELNGRDFARYWAQRPGRLRETVRRKRAKEEVGLRIASRFDPADWGAYEAVYARSWKPAEGSPAFLRRFAEAEAAAGNLRLGLATIGGLPVAAQLWTVEGGIAYIHKLAHVDTAKAHSPGTLLSAAMFEHAIDRDHVTGIDFGTGDDAYKRDWMDTVRPLHRLDIHWPGSPRAWPHLARDRWRSLVSAPRRG